jgi:hypothetical protein
MTNRRIFCSLGAMLISLLWFPSVASACAVCMTGREDDTRIAFELMTAFMTVTPFFLIGGVFWWLKGRLRELESRHDEARKLDTLPKSRLPGLARVD